MTNFAQGSIAGVRCEVRINKYEVQSTGRVVVLVGERGAKARVFAIENVRFVGTKYKVQSTGRVVVLVGVRGAKTSAE